MQVCNCSFQHLHHKAALKRANISTATTSTQDNLHRHTLCSDLPSPSLHICLYWNWDKIAILEILCNRRKLNKKDSFRGLLPLKTKPSFIKSIKLRSNTLEIANWLPTWKWIFDNTKILFKLSNKMFKNCLYFVYSVKIGISFSNHASWPRY